MPKDHGAAAQESSSDAQAQSGRPQSSRFAQIETGAILDMQTKTAPQSNENYVRKSLQGYLEGQKDLNWFIGVMRSGQMDATAIKQMLAGLPNYGLPERRKELSDWLDSQPK
ncbi:MAG: hypothetical protein WBQ10_20890 [Terriglobales bacterium]